MKYLKSFENYENFVDFEKFVHYYNDDNTELTISNRGYTEFPKDFVIKNTVEKLNCSVNKLTSLPELPTNLKELICYNNKLTSLPKLPNTLVNLDCDKNNIKELPELPESLEILSCMRNDIKHLPKLPKNLKDLTCIYTKLEDLPKLPENMMFCDIRFTNYKEPVSPENFKILKNDMNIYSQEQIDKFSSFEFQKEFLTKHPEKFENLKHIGYADGIEELFPHLFDMDELGLLD
jgi:hypothetical protein